MIVPRFQLQPQFKYELFHILQINCVLTLSKWLWNHKPQASGSATNFDNVMMKFINNKTEDRRIKKLMSICFFTITRPQTGQMLGINEGKRRGKLALNRDE